MIYDNVLKEYIMLHLLAIVVGLGLFGGVFWKVLAELSFSTKKSLLKSFLRPIFKEIEKGMRKNAIDVFSSAQSDLFSRLDIPDSIKKDLGNLSFSLAEKLIKDNSHSNLNSDDVVISNLNSDDVVITITNDSIQPFQLSQAMIQTCDDIVRGKIGDFAKAQAIFEWFEHRISYDHIRASQNGTGYRNARQVFEDRKGICGEMAFLYIVMAWYTGIKSASFVSVDIDNSGKKVSHACVSIFHNGKIILVDPAYHAFDIKHLKYEVWENEKTIRVFKSWN